MSHHQAVSEKFSIRAKFKLVNVVLCCFGLLTPVWGEAEDLIQWETLLRSSSSWDSKPYRSYPSTAPELTVLKITIPPNTTLPWHQHPMPSVGYVLSGEITVEKKSGRKQTFTQGQVIPEMVHEFHRGRTGNTSTILIAFYAGTLGLPLSQQP